MWSPMLSCALYSLTRLHCSRSPKSSDGDGARKMPRDLNVVSVVIHTLNPDVPNMLQVGAAEALLLHELQNVCLLRARCNIPPVGE